MLLRCCVLRTTVVVVYDLWRKIIVRWDGLLPEVPRAAGLTLYRESSELASCRQCFFLNEMVGKEKKENEKYPGRDFWRRNYFCTMLRLKIVSEKLRSRATCTSRGREIREDICTTSGIPSRCLADSLSIEFRAACNALFPTKMVGNCFERK